MSGLKCKKLYLINAITREKKKQKKNIIYIFFWFSNLNFCVGQHLFSVKSKVQYVLQCRPRWKYDKNMWALFTCNIRPKIMCYYYCYNTTFTQNNLSAGNDNEWNQTNKFQLKSNVRLWRSDVNWFVILITTLWICIDCKYLNSALLVLIVSYNLLW